MLLGSEIGGVLVGLQLERKKSLGLLHVGLKVSGTRVRYVKKVLDVFT